MLKKQNIVYIGGGNGGQVVLKALKNSDHHLSFIGPVSDNGGSQGRLIRDLKILPPADLRNSVLALLPEKSPWRKILSYRFTSVELNGHNLGNIFLAGLIKIFGNIEKAEEVFKELVGVRNLEIILGSKTRADLVIKLDNGREIIGEHLIDEVKGFNGTEKIVETYLSPTVKINSRAKKALTAADLIIIGPSDIYTSILPVLLIQGMISAIKRSPAKKIFFVNLMTKFGQTNNFRASDFISLLEKYLGGNFFAAVIINNGKIDAKILAARTKQQEQPVIVDRNNFSGGSRVIINDLLDKKIYEKISGDVLTRSIIKHDPKKIRKIINQILK